MIADAEVLVSASIGVSVAERDQSADEMLLAAVAAMKDAKRRGPGHVRVFTPELRQRTPSAAQRPEDLVARASDALRLTTP